MVFICVWHKINSDGFGICRKMCPEPIIFVSTMFGSKNNNSNNNNNNACTGSVDSVFGDL